MSKFFLLFLTFCLSTMVLADAGEFLLIKGSVKVKREQNYLSNLSKETPLLYGDLIEVGKDSLAIVKIDQQVTSKINQESSLQIEKPVHKNHTNLLLESGSAFVKYANANKKTNSLTLRAKAVAMGVRGTEFFASFGEKNSRDDVWMCVREGLVEISAHQKKTLVKSGEGVRVQKGEKISDPKPLKWTEKLNWEMDEKAPELENKVSIESAYTDILGMDYD